MLTLITEPALQKLHANIKPKEENINLNLNQLPYTLMAKTGDKWVFTEKHLGIYKLLWSFVTDRSAGQ